jgi:hypothetical protein
MEDERLAFFFDDGTGRRRALDPFRVERLLSRALKGEPLHKVIEAARCGVEAMAGPALERLDQAVSAAFGMPPLAPDGTGFTEKARRRVLVEWLRWQAEVKKNTAPPGNSPPATAPPPSPSPPPSATRSG